MQKPLFGNIWIDLQRQPRCLQLLTDRSQFKVSYAYERPFKEPLSGANCFQFDGNQGNLVSKLGIQADAFSMKKTEHQSLVPKYQNPDPISRRDSASTARRKESPAWAFGTGSIALTILKPLSEEKHW
jgi:hypothetical protein